MNGLIILDGPDGAGKTTLANEFIHLYDAKYMHLTYRFKDKMFTYQLACLLRAVKMSKDHLVIIDRQWMSEICYAAAYRGGSKWPLAYRLFDRIILKHSGIYVVCLPANLRDHMNAYECLKTQRDELYEDISPVIIEYHKLWDKVKDWPNVMRYSYQDWPMDQLESFCVRVKVVLESWQEKQWPRALDPEEKNFLGHLDTAKFLFIAGDADSSARSGKWYPFMSYLGSDVLLLEVMERLHIPENEVVWTNYDVDPSVTRELLSTYDLCPVVFNSTVFDKMVKHFGSMTKCNNPQKCYHPAYVKRVFNGAGLYWSLCDVINRMRNFRLGEG